jgi:DNA-binding response OmpR family regulator
MPATPPGPRRKILIVEDSRTQAEYLRHILEEDGFRVILAEGGAEALEQLAVDLPALILTDVVMPGMDGYDLCRAIRRDIRTAAIPVVLVTQLFDPVDVIRGVSAGADDFIVKPFEPAYIRARIAEILSRIGQADPDGSLPPLPVTFGGATHLVTGGRMRILHILLSTYEVAVSKNAELEEAKDRLSGLNEKLQEAIDQMKAANGELARENAERRRIEKALDEANRKLNLMASITRHDVLNQLTTQHELLEGALARKETGPEAWSQVRSAAAIGMQTINAIRFTGDYQKIGIKEPAWHNLRSLIGQAAAAVPAGPVRVENLVPENVLVYADPLIGTIFTNLIENAVKYGTVLTTIRFTLTGQEGAYIIACQDNGVGVPPDKKEKIFQYEYGMNTSMGLFLSREILGLTGITIRETGEYRNGARFEILCPAGTLRTG